MSGRRRRLIAAAAAAAALGVLVPIGQRERRRDFAAQNRGIAHVRAAIGPLDSPALYGYRVLPGFDCLLYARGGNPLALELCVDSAGRIVEAVDRRGAERRYYSIHGDAAAASVIVDGSEVRRLLRKMGAAH